VISDDAKIDNLVHIAHNAKIGARAIIIAQTCIGGSAIVGDDAWIGIGAAISNGVKIGARARVLLNAVVPHDVADDEIVSGFYAMSHRQWKRVYARLKEI
jgi:UDP-3-O-[3-hydroxymyristoyl] glucosamine N-acyltransferase